MSVTWQRINATLLILVLLTLAGLVAILATRAEGGPLDPPGPPGSTDGVRQTGTPIAGPTTISSPGRYYLTRNITVSGGNSGIFISNSDIDLDLGGFTITGGGTGAGGFGIYVSGAQTNVGVHDGTVRTFQFGLSAAGAKDMHIDHIRAYGNARGIEIGSYTTLTNCVSTENTETGVRVVGLRNLIQTCLISLNGANGVSIEGAENRIEASAMPFNNVASNSAWGSVSISGSGNLISNVSVGANYHDIVIPAAAFFAQDNVVIDTVCSGLGVAVQNGQPQSIGSLDHANTNCPSP